MGGARERYHPKELRVGRVKDRVTEKAADRLKIAGQVSVPCFVGGIGPASELPFEADLLEENLTATSDQQHIGWILLNETSFPDRTGALMARKAGDSSLYEEIRRRIINDIRFAGREGFGSISFLCNTIHAWRDDPLVQRELKRARIPWVSLMDATVEMILENYPVGTRVGVLATSGTLDTGLYERALREAGLEPISFLVESPEQETVMQAIYNKEYGIKATGAMPSERAKTELATMADALVNEHGVGIIIGGCTEIPMALNENTYDPKRAVIIDPIRALARAHLILAMGDDRLIRR